MVNVLIRRHEDDESFVATPALIDTGADYSAITPLILDRLTPFRTGEVYVENYSGRGEMGELYAVCIELHGWQLTQLQVVVGSDEYVILGRDLLNRFDLRLNGIDGKLEFLRGPQIES